MPLAFILLSLLFAYKSKLIKPSDNLKLGIFAATCTLNIIVSNKLNKYKVYNFSNEGYTNWYDFTKKIFELKKINCPIIAVNSDKYKSIANRPKYCITDKSRIKNIFNITIRNWNEALEEFINKL